MRTQYRLYLILAQAVVLIAMLIAYSLSSHAWLDYFGVVCVGVACILYLVERSL